MESRIHAVMFAVAFGAALLAGLPGSCAAQTLAANPVVFPLLAPRVSSKYGNRIHPIRKFSAKHNGVDLAAPEYSHVRAMAPGRVIFADTHFGYGKLVTIEHQNGAVSLYGHLSEIRANLGQKVEAGELIGRIGSTGRSTGPHLHLEWRENGTPIDPLRRFPYLAEDAAG